MAIYKKELLKYSVLVEANNVEFFTCNTVIKRNGDLVMGAGNAKAVKDLHPNAPAVFGMLINKNPNERIWLRVQGEGCIGAFQTKEHFKDPSPLSLVADSLCTLASLATKHPDWTFHLPMPGVNHGGLDFGIVKEMTDQLPDNVIIYHR